jgi:hypothetical protein
MTYNRGAMSCHVSGLWRHAVNMNEIVIIFCGGERGDYVCMTYCQGAGGVQTCKTGGAVGAARCVV